MKRQWAIREMFNGNRGRCDQIPMTEKYRQLLAEAEESEEAFLSALGKKERLIELYKKAKEDLEEIWSSECDSYYCEGFRFGVLLGMDIMDCE